MGAFLVGDGVVDTGVANFPLITISVFAADCFLSSLSRGRFFRGIFSLDIRLSFSFDIIFLSSFECGDETVTSLGMEVSLLSLLVVVLCLISLLVNLRSWLVLLEEDDDDEDELELSSLLVLEEEDELELEVDEGEEEL